MGERTPPPIGGHVLYHDGRGVTHLATVVRVAHHDDDLDLFTGQLHPDEPTVPDAYDVKEGTGPHTWERIDAPTPTWTIVTCGQCGSRNPSFRSCCYRGCITPLPAEDGSDG